MKKGKPIVLEPTLLKNMERKKPVIDTVHFTDKGPLPSFIDLNSGEFCNRKCPFCPRSDPSTYPNQKLFLNKKLAIAIESQLREINFQGILNICGTGEPLAHPNIFEVTEILSKSVHVEVVTNGDYLNKKNIGLLYAAGLKQLVISAYDGPHQIPKFDKLMKDCLVSKDLYNIRKRWFSEEEGYGIKKTNRGGLLDEEFEKEDVNNHCAYPHYSLTIDFNGDVLLCVQDWTRKVKFGNVYAETIEEIWFSKRMNEYRKNLIKGRDKAGTPCTNCNADGMVVGRNHYEAWRNIYAS